MGYKLGLVSISFRSLSVTEILSAMKKTGLSCVEWGSDVHAPKDDAEKLKAIVKLQKEYGITCSSYGTYFNLGVDNTGELESYVNAAKILGTDILRLWCGDKGSMEYTESERESLLNECEKAAKIAEKHKVKFCLECHNWTYTDTKESALWLVNNVNSPNFLMYWQPNQFFSYDANIDFAIKTSPYSKHIHVFNWKVNLRFSLQESIAEWEKYLSCFEENKTFLLEFMPDNDIKSLPYEVEALKKIIGDI
jgi:sugar phosphate isomerase/epimerase